MKLLLDTCVVLWLMMDTKQISPALLEILADPKNKRYLSSVAVWEMVVKYQLRKLDLPKPPNQFVAEIKSRGSFLPLPLEDVSVLQLSKLPALHRDPFDRMLICQAIEDSMTLVTSDPLITQYPVKTLWL